MCSNGACLGLADWRASGTCLQQPTYPDEGAMDPGARAAPLVAWSCCVLLAPDPEAPLPPTPEPLPVLETVAEPANPGQALSDGAPCNAVITLFSFILGLLVLDALRCRPRQSRCWRWRRSLPVSAKPVRC